MDKEIIAYDVVIADSSEELVKRVNKLIAAGFQPYGFPDFGDWKRQALVKYRSLGDNSKGEKNERE